MLDKRDDQMSEAIKKFTITGRPGSGKSTLLRRLVASLAWQSAGFTTLPYYIEGERRGFYLHSLLELPNSLNNLPISVVQTPGHSVGVGESFRSLGMACLRQALVSSSDGLVLDEIGRFEQNEADFLDTLQTVFSQYPKPILAVLKAEEIPFLQELKKRPDFIHIDLDQIDREEAFHLMLAHLQAL